MSLRGQAVEGGGGRVDVRRPRPQERLARLDQPHGDDEAVVGLVEAGGGAELTQMRERRVQLVQRGDEIRLVRRSVEGIDVVALAEHPFGAGRELSHVVERDPRLEQTRQPGARAACGPASAPAASPIPPAPAGAVASPPSHSSHRRARSISAAEPVELLERGVDAGLDGELAQEPSREAVDGADGRVVEGVEGARDGGGLGGAGRRRLRAPLELLAHTSDAARRPPSR